MSTMQGGDHPMHGVASWISSIFGESTSSVPPETTFPHYTEAQSHHTPPFTQQQSYSIPPVNVLVC